MNESILEALKEMLGLFDENSNSLIFRMKAIATSAIKKLEDSSGKETGMKWVKASERLPAENEVVNIKVNSTLNGIGCLFGTIFFMKFFNGTIISSNDSCYNPKEVAWLDESVPQYKEEVNWDEAIKEANVHYEPTVIHRHTQILNYLKKHYKLLESKEEAVEDKP